MAIDEKNNHSWKKILIGIVIIVILTILVIGIIKILGNLKDNQIDYKSSNYKYFELYGENNLVGAIDRNGNEIIKPKYIQINIPNNEEKVFFCYEDDENYVILNERGEKIFTEFEEVLPIRTSDLFVVSFEKQVLKYKENDKYGLIDFNGSKVTEAIYQSIASLENKPGAIIAKKDGKYGVINSNGKIIVDFKYDNIVGDGLYIQEDEYKKTGYIVKQKTKNGDLYGYLNYKGNKVLDVKYESIQRVLDDKNDIFLICMSNGKKGVFKNKREIIPFEYQNIIYANSSNIFIVQKGNKNGFISNSGKQILETKYEEYALAGNYISVTENNQKLLYDINGNPLNNINYISMIETENPEYFIAQKESGNYCIISKSTIVDEDFKSLNYLFDNLFVFLNEEGKYGIVDVWNGNVLKPEYDYILKVEGKNAIEAKKLNSTEIYSKEIELVSTMSDAIVENISEDYAIIYSESDKKYIDKNGKLVENTVVYPNNEIYSVKEETGWGFIDKSGNKVVECKYDFVTELNEYGFASISKNGKWGVVDSKGTIIAEPQYNLEVYYMPKFVGKYILKQEETLYCEEIKK